MVVIKCFRYLKIILYLWEILRPASKTPVHITPLAPSLAQSCVNNNNNKTRSHIIIQLSCKVRHSIPVVGKRWNRKPNKILITDKQIDRARYSRCDYNMLIIIIYLYTSLCAYGMAGLLLFRRRAVDFRIINNVLCVVKLTYILILIAVYVYYMRSY